MIHTQATCDSFCRCPVLNRVGMMAHWARVLFRIGNPPGLFDGATACCGDGAPTLLGVLCTRSREGAVPDRLPRSYSARGVPHPRHVGARTTRRLGAFNCT